MVDFLSQWWYHIDMTEVILDRSPHCWDVVDPDGDVKAADKWDRVSREPAPSRDKGYEEYLRRCVKRYIDLTQASESPGDRARRRAMDKCKD